MKSILFAASLAITTATAAAAAAAPSASASAKAAKPAAATAPAAVQVPTRDVPVNDFMQGRLPFQIALNVPVPAEFQQSKVKKIGYSYWMRPEDAATATAANLPTRNGYLYGSTATNVTYDAATQQWRWWRNGALVATLADTEGVATLADVNNFLGRSNYTPDANWAGTMREFRIYDYALSAAQVLGNLEAGPDALNLGAPGPDGSVVVSGAGTISTNGASDSFQFASQTMDGDGEFIARLVSKSGTAPSGIMLRESTATGSRTRSAKISGYRSGRPAVKRINTCRSRRRPDS